jgi:hypothetical protein
VPQELSLEDSTASTGSVQGEAIEDWQRTLVSVLVEPTYDGKVFHARIADLPALHDTRLAPSIRVQKP